MRFWETITNLATAGDAIGRRRFGCIEMQQGRFVSLRLSLLGRRIYCFDLWWSDWVHRRREGDRSWLYYQQPLFSPNFLSLMLVVSTREGSLGSLYGGLCVLDEIARIKQSDAIVCEAHNPRISDRLLARWGWERHVPGSRQRHYIKRFYGEYPHPPVSLVKRQPALSPESLISSAASCS